MVQNLSKALETASYTVISHCLQILDSPGPPTWLTQIKKFLPNFSNPPQKTNSRHKEKINSLYLPEKVTSFQSKNVLHFRCVLNTVVLFFMLAKLNSVFDKPVRVLSKRIIQSLFVKWFYFSIFCNIFFYTKLAFVFYLQNDFHFVCKHIVAFCFSLQKDIDTFHKIFVSLFL